MNCKTLYRLRAAIGDRLGSRWIQVLLALKTDHRFAAHYGDFHFGTSYRKQAVTGLDQESGKIYGGVVHFLRQLPHKPESLLLPGENKSVKAVYAALLGMKPEQIVTAGIMDDMDVRWNFEEAPPLQARYDCIVSQSMLEHLVDPYKHVRDCAALISPGGHLILQTVMPGFPYHRHPVDCMRFYPDWFEEISKRLALTITDKYIRNARITYLFTKDS
jgi:SAM-dependent methyltransferase